MQATARAKWLAAHRWMGLFMTLFLVVAGLTGCVLPFYAELDRYLDPQLHRVAPHGVALSPILIWERAQSLVPHARAELIELGHAPDESLRIVVAPKIDPVTLKPYKIGFDELFFDPYSGRLLGARRWGEVRFDRRHLVPMLTRMHYSLALPEPWGRWLFGIAALCWVLSCFVGFYLTLPLRRKRFFASWRAAWLVSLKGSLPKISFDLHRAAGLWTWALLLVLALSAVQLTLNDELFKPALRAVLPLKDPEQVLAARPHSAPGLGWEQALVAGRKLMAQRATRAGFGVASESRLTLNRELGVYIYGVRSTFDIRDQGGETLLYLSAADGRALAFVHPYSASGNALSGWLSALHMARVWGLPFRIVISAMGLIVATLAFTGVIVWLKRRPHRASSFDLAAPSRR